MTNKATRKVYRLCSLSEWEMSQFTGVLPINDDDIRDGFFHLSFEDQTKKIATKYYSQVSDLYILTILIDDISDILRVEANKDGELFPHAYGPMPRSKVLFAKPAPSKDGVYHFPKELFQ
ncbi:MAG: DUF952 domain-containing protein [Robiginitomaculum sp.]|nr:DUF952 domain-containing protein [Robiginitomaculum sp.]